MCYFLVKDQPDRGIEDTLGLAVTSQLENYCVLGHGCAAKIATVPNM